ncbi:MAG: ATP-binding cassette domain-containing protein, partial [Pseudonocardiaceae bacterium]
MALLELRELSVSYPTSGPAVRGASMRLAAGETVGLAGESGCGKTTLGLAALRLLPRDAEVSGEILLDGEDVHAMSWGRLRAVRWAAASMVFQGAMHALNPVRRVAAQIAEPIRLHRPGVGRGELRHRVASLVAQVGLPARHGDAYPHQLSGGQRQRVMIAMALACEPRLVIADEPTTALDVVVQAQVLALLAELVAHRGIGLLLIGHDLPVLAASCDRLDVMHAGTIVESGPAVDVLRAPAHPHTAALCAAFPAVGDPGARWAHRRAATSTVLRAEGLRVAFGAARAVDGVDLQLGAGEIVALVGESGCGKTTLARALLGLQRPTAGRVLVDGTPLPTSARGLRDYRRSAQLIGQDPTGALSPRQTVYQAVAEGLRIHRLTDAEPARVAQALSRAELRPPERFFRRYPQQLSGGQRQRVVIAGALVLSPRLLIADEPVSSLDAPVRGEILALLLRLRDELGLAALVVTHDLGLAWTVADRVAVMYLG